jgi:hypothetical protein
MILDKSDGVTSSIRLERGRGERCKRVKKDEKERRG